MKKETFKDVMKKEAEAILSSIDSFDDDIEKAVDLILNCKGKVVVTGVGKSGHVGEKIAATFASTGTPAFFMHATEGVHGDLGMIEERDVVIMISNSGETNEVLNLLPSLNKINPRKIAITKSKQSTLAKMSDVSLVYNYKEECDHLNLAPSVSSTLTLVVGDALALTVSKAKNFTKEGFHLYHPGGSLGKKLGEQK